MVTAREKSSHKLLPSMTRREGDMAGTFVRNIAAVPFASRLLGGIWRLMDRIVFDIVSGNRRPQAAGPH
jgi:hypothetical protein